MADVLIPMVSALIIHDSEGDRLFAKYYDFRAKNKAAQLEFESILQKKTKSSTIKNEAEVILIDNEVIVYHAGSDCKFYVVGSAEENELILAGVLDTIYDAISQLMKGQVDKVTMLDNLELILLTIDEALDHGAIMELDASAIVSRVLMKGYETNATSNSGQSQPQTVGDLSLAQALGLARDSLFKSLGSR